MNLHELAGLFSTSFSGLFSNCLWNLYFSEFSSPEPDLGAKMTSKKEVSEIIIFGFGTSFFSDLVPRAAETPQIPNFLSKITYCSLFSGDLATISLSDLALTCHG